MNVCGYRNMPAIFLLHTNRQTYILDSIMFLEDENTLGKVR